ncbi:efflux RND transporter periplasmic adaptor subunit [Biformimicrobium ophioploci]|uniref:Efflux RND transporter periplasmic adaptor subunit n=1 Tax=Biformimicrobium ophioploci TaxID=3036711 RepID=A0ABQ6LUJ9_9GAMM|nr:efflux RND transporter periplasmic adaptor subunit [Microbulbifer sp. NKW57]GMG85763.1 efflux RND transporter periplasmic adaptor subunit [Microbulbifer sp. NKW57]
MKHFFSAALLLLVATAAMAQPGRPVAVAVEQVQVRLLSPSLWSPARVASRRDVRVASEINGLLRSVAEPGTRVARGELLAQLDDTYWQLQLRTDESRILQLKARLKYMDAQLERLQQLSETNSTSRSALEEQAANREAIAQDLASAEIARDRTRYELGKTRIVAPFDALVVSRERQAGEYVRTGEPLLRAIARDALEAEADVPLSAVPYLANDAVLTVRSGDQFVEAPVRQLVPATNPGSRTVKLLLSLPADSDWIFGAPIQVAVPTAAPREALVVPRDALVLRETGTFVFRVGAEGIAERIMVTAGGGESDWISVSGPLKDGDQVVVRGAERLLPGQKLKILPAPLNVN